jgi:hypothetical protein
VGRRRRGRGTGSEDLVARAIESFNSSDASHLVAGLMRTLGEPQASIGAAAGSPAEVRVTVAWELTWYQWAVAADGERPSVSQLARGAELDQLDGAARVWNAGVAEGGRLYVGRPPRRAARRRRLW